MNAISLASEDLLTDRERQKLSEMGVKFHPSFFLVGTFEDREVFCLFSSFDECYDSC